ncbi:MAG: RNA polymerase sigma factor [Gemmatimonadota bacterium]|nr:RNA polymerase sigma factor [Gemmatimonadota bacterium]
MRRPRTESAMLSYQQILDLARRATKGERKALGRLAGALRPLICRWALVMTGDPTDAEDVAQQVLMKMMASMEGFDGRSRVTTWAYRITKNASLDHQRRAKRDRRLAEKADRLALAEPPRLDDPLDDIEMKRTMRLIGILLAELPMRQREVFDLVDLQGLEPREAAELLEMNPNTLRVHLLRARRRMRTEMLARGFAYGNTGE